MAERIEMDEDDGGEPKPAMKSILLGGLIAIVIGGGSGFSLGYFSGPPPPISSEVDAPPMAEATPAKSGSPTDENPDQDHGAKSVSGETDKQNHPESGEVPTFVTAIDPIVTNLTDPKDIWIRLELVLTSNQLLENDMASQIHQDLFAHVRAMRLSEMAGPSAFIDLKAELLARARQRSEGHVQKVYVKTLVYE